MLNNKKLVKFVALASAAAFGVTIPAITDASSTRSSEARIQHERPARPSRDEVGKTGQNRTERQPREVRHEQERTDEREHATHREESRDSFYEVNRQENIKEVNKENKVEDEYNRESANRKDTDTVIYSRDDEDDKQDINITINNNVNVDNDVNNDVNNNVENNVDNRVDNDVNNENTNNNLNSNENDVRNENNNINTNKNTNNNDNDNTNSNTNINDNDNTNSNDNDITNNDNNGGSTPSKKDEVVYSNKILGDVNSDGKVTQADAELLVDYIGEKIACEDLDLSVADVNKDNTINIMDAVNILNYVKGKDCSPGIGERIPINDFIIVEENPFAGMTLYKPVIYLYPTKKTNVFVNLDFDGTFTCTYPKINDGWKVVAEPDGTLTDNNGRKYSYLFWEGDTKVPMEFNEGFCVSGKDTEAFLLEKLAYLGLNDKEINDFMVFWLPRMQENPYNVISFQTDNYLKAAQLEVSPRPDTMIRVFMAWKKADNFVDIKEQKLAKTQRKGFALVEWGGTEVMDGTKNYLIQ
ncbi:dockerin type I repeat-containing protein [Anaerovibrio slackiae]|nr:dockerin type I repeat-containing protein [Anaerovibrio slackiae]